jgi:hypothetical protein
LSKLKTQRVPSKHSKVSKASLAEVVDQLGRVRAQQSDLKDEEERLKTILKQSGLEELEGSLFRATVNTHPHTTVDWKSIAQTFNPPKRLIKKHSETEPRTVVKVVARNSNRKGDSHENDQA